METDEIETDEISTRCLGCGKEVQVVLADFPICENCYAEIIKDWLKEAEVNIPDDLIELMVDEHIDFLRVKNEEEIEKIKKEI